MEAYVDEVRKLEGRFDGIQAEHIPRVENDIADYLSKRAAFKLPVEPGTFFASVNSTIRRAINGAEQAKEVRSQQVLSYRAPWGRQQGCCHGR